MKLAQPFKSILLSTCFFVYISGFLVWWLEYKTEVADLRTSSLHVHSIISLWFMIVFGYLYHSHIQRGLRSRRRLWSGVILTSIICALIFTVPFLFYLSSEEWRERIANIHTLIGLSVVAPFLAHFLFRSKTHSVGHSLQK